MLKPTSRSILWSLLAITAIAAFFRFIAPSNWPTYADESVYGQVVHAMMSLPLKDHFQVSAELSSKPVLVSWLRLAVAQFTGEYILCGRIVSAAAGTLCVVVSYLLGKRLGGQAVGLLTALLMAISPWMILHDRMSFQDSVLTLLGLLAILATCEAVERHSYRTGVLALLAAFLAVQAKQSGALLFPMLLLIAATQPGKGRLRNRIAICVAIAVGGTLLAFALQRLGVIGHPVGDDYHFSPLVGTRRNSIEFLQSLYCYLGPALILLAITGLIVCFRRDRRAAALLAGAILFWSLPPILFSNGAPSRYHLPAVPFMLVLVSMGIHWLWTHPRHQTPRLRIPAAALIVLGLAWPLVNSTLMVRDLRRAALAEWDDLQYRTGRLAGYAPRKASAVLDHYITDGCQVIYWMRPPQMALYSTNYPRITSPRVLKTVVARNEKPAILPNREAYILLLGKCEEVAQNVDYLQRTYPVVESLGSFDNPRSITRAMLVRIPPSTQPTQVDRPTREPQATAPGAQDTAGGQSRLPWNP